MRRPRGAIDGVARIATAEGRHAGMGILVEHNRVLTCAHVVNVALARSIDDARPPKQVEPILVGFPFAASTEPYRGRVVAWSAPGLGNSDAALIALEEDAPEEVGLATLAKIPDPSLLTGEMTVFGMTGEQILGGHVEVALLGPVSGGWWQLVGTRDIGTYAVRGFSGAAVWSRAQRAVVGMLVAVANEPEEPDRDAVPPTPAERRTAYAQPVDVLKAAIGDLSVEGRTGLADAFQRLLASSTFVLFLVALVHLLALHSAGVRQFLPYAQGSSLLVAFFSAQIVGILAVLGFWLILRHVRAFSASRPWETRFPSLLGRYPSDSLFNTRTGSLIGLLLIVLLPIWTVGDALSEFYQERYVVLFAGSGEEFRADPRVGLMRTAPEEGLYRIAGIGDAKNAVSFFPVVQPILVVALAAASLALALAIVAELFVRPRLGSLGRFLQRPRGKAQAMGNLPDDDDATAPEDLLGGLSLSELASDDEPLPSAGPLGTGEAPGAGPLSVVATFAIAPAGEPQAEHTKFTATDSRTGKSFYIGQITTYNTRMGLSRRSDAVIYDRTRYAQTFGDWAHFIWPSAMAESAGQEVVINAWDRARFTWGFYQLAAHTPNDNLILLMRRLVALPTAGIFFPDLGLDDEGRLTRKLDSGEVVSLEQETEVKVGKGSEQQIVDFMNYLNPSSTRFDDAEAVTSAKFIAWAAEDPAMLETTLSVSIEIMKSKIRDWAQVLGLIGQQPELAIWVSDIVHQSRGTRKMLVDALAQPTFETRLDALSRIDRYGTFGERLKTVRASVDTLMAEKRFEGVAFGSGSLAL